MKSSTRIFLIASHCLWTGLVLMSLALFLHPMNPEDFFALLFSEPLRTLRDAYGIQAAVLFWASAALIAAGLAGLVYSMKFMLGHVMQQRRLAALANVDDKEENWVFL